MAVFLITCHFGKDGDQNHSKLLATIQSLGPAIEITKFTWFVSTQKTGDEIGMEIDACLCDYDNYVLFDVGKLPEFVMSSRPYANNGWLAI
ncbi:MAG TPA: hypothetical protein VG097_08115 [Gemmata sp.]|nr:hypothetical protein [Gemmata sp.]